MTENMLAWRKALIGNCFEQMNAALSTGDIAQCSDILNYIALEFGGELKFRTFDEFDAFMLNSKGKLIL